MRFSSLGDVILTSAPVLNLKINFPDSHIVFLTKERYRPLLTGFDGVDEVVTLPEDAGPIDYFELLLRLDDHNFDTIVDWHGNFRSWLGRQIITANTKVVYPKRRYERLKIVKTHKIPGTWLHTIDLYNRCVTELGGRIVCKRPVIQPTKLQAELANTIGALAAKGPLIVIAPGAAHPNKQWSMERFAEVAVSLHQLLGASFVWAVISNDKGTSRLLKKIPQDCFVELVDCPIEQLAAVIYRARLTIANDSGVAHLSSAVGTPVITVFGPTHPSLGFAPRGLFDRVVDVDEFCRPCSLHGKKPCYREGRYCFTRLSPEKVCETAGEILNSNISSSRALLVDRDGTVIDDKNFLSDPDQIEFVPGAIEALKLAKEMGLKVIIISNQSGVARGFFGMDTVERINERLLSILANNSVEVDGLFYCPHLADGTVKEFAVACDCRKPAPGMAEKAAKELGIDLRQSYVIGDKIDDINLARVIGARTFMVRTGHGSRQEQRLNLDGIINRTELVFDNLLTSVHHIKAIERHD